MKFKLFGRSVKITHSSSAETRASLRTMELGSAAIESIPRLRRQGPLTAAPGVGELIEQGWTADEVARVVDSWPTVGQIPLTALIQFAGQIRRDRITDVDEIIGWTHAIFEPTDSDSMRMKPFVRQQLTKAGERPNPVAAIRLWTTAAGSAEAGRDALARGVALDDLRP